jgi:hypothetical protein
MKFAVLAVAITVAGCAMDPAQQAALQARRESFAASRPRCYDQSACERVWAAARNWVLANCGMKIQTMTNDYIETYNAVGGTTALHCRVTKDPLPDSGYVLTVGTNCDNLFGCFPDAWQAAENFNYVVQAAAPLSDKPTN